MAEGVMVYLVAHISEPSARNDEPKEIPKVSPPNVNEKKGRYVLLPTIPAMKVFVGEDELSINSEPKSVATPQPVSTSPSGVSFTPALSMAPTIAVPTPLPRPSPISAPMVTTSLVTTPTYLNSLSAVAPIATTTASGPAFSVQPTLTPEQILATLLPSSMVLQNTLLQQQNQALVNQLLGFTPALTQPATTCAADVLALLRAQQSAQLAAALATPPKPTMPLIPNTSDDLIQSLLAQSRQPIYSYSL
uniref:POU domain, class 6, transcription factor 2 n=1 Tax=Heterorhabditis bacteriophora TaxID=37862 RepID=A0A1I7XJL7_HETBA